MTTYDVTARTLEAHGNGEGPASRQFTLPSPPPHLPKESTRAAGTDSSLANMIFQQIYPALYARPDAAFPELELTRRNGSWILSEQAASKLFPSPESGSVFASCCPLGLRSGSGVFLTWLNCVSGGIRELPGKAFFRAVHELARRAGFEIADDQFTESDIEAAQKEHRAAHLLEAFLAHGHALLQGLEGKELRNRLAHCHGITPPEMERVELGVCPSSQAALGRLAAYNFTEHELIASGIFTGARIRADFAQGRLFGAWRNRHGVIEFFWSRSVSEGEEAPEYLLMKNPARADLPLHGAYELLRNGIDGVREVLLVHDLVEAMILNERGISGAVALGRPAEEFSDQCWEKLSQLGVRSVVLALENHKHGRSETLSLLRTYFRAQEAPQVRVHNPEGLGIARSACEYVSIWGASRFMEHLAGCESATVFRGRSLLGDVCHESSYSERAQAVKRVQRFLEHEAVSRCTRSDAELILQELTERTGFRREEMEPIALLSSKSGYREEFEDALDEAIRSAAASRQSGTDAAVVARHLLDSLRTLRIPLADSPEAFSVERLERESASLGSEKSSGWKALDRLLPRFCAEELTLFATRTGHGKTSFLVNLLVNWLRAAEQAESDELFVFYSAEEPEVHLFQRLLTILASSTDRWTIAQVRAYLQNPSEGGEWPDLEALETARKRLSSWQDRLQLVSRPAWSLTEVEQHLHMLRKERRIGAVILDSVAHLPSGSDRHDPFEGGVQACRLKSLAMELKAPVVVGVELSCEPAWEEIRKRLLQRKGYADSIDVLKCGRPSLAHLPCAGLYQEADLVLGGFSYACYYQEQSGRSISEEWSGVSHYELGVLKQRCGSVGEWAMLGYDWRQGIIRDVDPEELF